jgi:NitT/TauT family transport system ATP-binding protein
VSAVAAARTTARPRADRPSIEAELVTKVFTARAQRVVALEDVSFSVSPGEFLAVVGPSGCGKSTLLRVLGGLLPPSSGGVRVHGEPVAGPREDVGIMFQSPVLLPWKTAFENAFLPRRLRGDRSASSHEQTQELLDLVGLQGFERAYPWQLSGGMQQRVALARLLNTGADILLLDEPFGALDEFTRERMNLELMRVCAEVGATAVFVTHNIQEAVFLADRVAVMSPRPGRIAGVVTVNLPRPRGIEALRAPEFTELVFRARDLLGESA